MDGEALLGPLHYPWKIRTRRFRTFDWKPEYLNSLTGEVSEEDPRLGSLSSEWERLEFDRCQDDLWVREKFRNRITKEVINSDPRLLPDVLRTRGVKLETFQLI
jgi:hypothetical protein